MDPERDNMNQFESVQNYHDVVETLINMFGNGLSKEVICSIVESCDGDLNEAANAVMNMINDGNSLQSENNNDNTQVENVSEQTDEIGNTAATMSYAGAFKKPHSNKQDAQSSVLQQPSVSKNTIPNFWTDQIQTIVDNHNQGKKLLIVMRGLPGSGKTYLAKKIVEITVGSHYNEHILSTDDFFYVRGVYRYNKFKLSEAHDWNKKRASEALNSGKSPILIDNTNIELWEMEPYVREGIGNGYVVELVEPTTSWAKKPNILCKKNSHNVVYPKIKQMLNNFQPTTLPYLLKYLRIEYPDSVKPPVLNAAPLEIATTIVKVEEMEQQEVANINELPQTTTNKTEYDANEIPVDLESLQEQEVIEQQLKYMKIQKQLDEMEKLEQEWENGENWDEESHSNNENKPGSPTNISKPPRNQLSNTSAESNITPKILPETFDDQINWSKISMFMNPWENNLPSTSQTIPEVVEKKDAETCVDIGDYDALNQSAFKVLVTYPKDINFNHISPEREKIPVTRMLDKSTSTNDQTTIETHRCKNEEKHFIAFRKLFKNKPKAVLREIFDKCCGDVNWAVDIVLDGMANKELTLVGENEELSDFEDQIEQDCDCISIYEIIPDVSSEDKLPIKKIESQIESDNKTMQQPQKKVKKEKNVSESTLELKRKIEKNVVVSDNYYSKQCLKLRNLRYGIDDEKKRGNLSEPIVMDSEVPDNELQPALTPVASTSQEKSASGNSNKTSDEESDDDNDDESSYIGEPEKSVMIDLSKSLLTQLDDLFGRKGIEYPPNASPKVNVPISMLNELNALWIESLMSQLDEQDKQTELMVKEDEEFARQLMLKEQELAESGREPDVPDLKEIMDMDFAISLYQREVAKWRQKEPTDLAAKLTRDKLYNLFPEVSHEILSELLMAHDNNFQATVEVLLMSTGKADILEDKKGVSKFVMEKEMEIKRKILEEEKKALSEVNWPILPKASEVNMQTVEEFRDRAEKHLAERQKCYHKAHEYVKRGMTLVANYYCYLSNFHKLRYEQANSLAAASLIQVHASSTSDNATIDLHYLRVAEAVETLDLFLDTHIQKLKENHSRSVVKQHTLFFITGRGLHSSNGRPRIKPAVRRRLRERGLACSERNPGLLTTKVCAHDKLSYEVSST